MASLIGLDLSKNLSYFTVPVAFALTLAPHAYSVLAGGRKNFDNSKPRDHQQKIINDQSLDSITKGRIIRADNASKNQFETLGFYAAAVVAANQAGVPARELNFLTFSYVFSRAFYIYAYIVLSATRGGAAVRSLTWMFSVGTSVMLFVKAGFSSMNNTLF